MSSVKPVVKNQAQTVLEKLRVRPGLQRSTVVIQSQPFVCVDFFYDKQTEHFAVRVSWPLKTKTVFLSSDEIADNAQKWRMDCTFRMTKAAIARLAPSLDALLSKVLSELRASKLSP